MWSCSSLVQLPRHPEGWEDARWWVEGEWVDGWVGSTPAPVAPAQHSCTLVAWDSGGKRPSKMATAAPPQALGLPDARGWRAVAVTWTSGTLTSPWPCPCPGRRRLHLGHQREAAAEQGGNTQPAAWPSAERGSRLPAAPPPGAGPGCWERDGGVGSSRDGRHPMKPSCRHNEDLMYLQ